VGALLGDGVTCSQPLEGIGLVPPPDSSSLSDAPHLLGKSIPWHQHGEGSQETPNVLSPIPAWGLHPAQHPYLDREGERHEAEAAEVHVDGVEDGPEEVVAGRRGAGDGGGRVPLVGRGGRVVIPRVGGVHGHGEGHPTALRLHQLRSARGAGQHGPFI